MHGLHHFVQLEQANQTYHVVSLLQQFSHITCALIEAPLTDGYYAEHGMLIPRMYIGLLSKVAEVLKPFNWRVPRSCSRRAIRQSPRRDVLQERLRAARI